MTDEVKKPDEVTILLGDILKELRIQNSQSAELWGPEEIGNLIKLGKGTVQNKILNTPSFPTSIVLPTGGRRWVAKEVKAWALRRTRD